MRDVCDGGPPSGLSGEFDLLAQASLVVPKANRVTMRWVLDGDGDVGAADLSLVLAAWGPCG